jgi:hypothetical protein
MAQSELCQSCQAKHGLRLGNWELFAAAAVLSVPKRFHQLHVQLAQRPSPLQDPPGIQWQATGCARIDQNAAQNVAAGQNVVSASDLTLPQAPRSSLPPRPAAARQGIRISHCPSAEDDDWQGLENQAGLLGGLRETYGPSWSFWQLVQS